MAYIDTKYLGKCETCRHHRNGGCDTWCENGECYSPNMSAIPTADVVEVKHGEWKDRYGNKYYNHLYECSVCGKEALYECYKNELDQWAERQALTPACPYCFAKMDGGKEE